MLALALAVLGVVLGGAGFYFGLSAKNSFQFVLDSQENSLSESVLELALTKTEVENISEEKEALKAAVSRLRAYGKQRDQHIKDLSEEFNQLKEGLATGVLGVSPSAENIAKGRATLPTVDGGYVIQSGDTFSGIATKSGVKLKLLLDANPGVDPRRLRIGQTIIIPNE
ncbi:MAG: Uncharacterised protein [Opitutia bacterium UBA7350]|nr:MAG: Uncharacterised protein [Opitutae bacterium UBA7350]